MSVSLTKGGNVSLTKQAGAAGLTAVTVGLGWDVRTTTGTDFDLDASAHRASRPTARSLSDQHFVFYSNLTSPDGAIEHTGDNLTGEGEGDDEQIKVNLARCPPEVDKIVFPVRIYDADSRAAVLRPGPQRLHPRRQPGRRRGARPLRPDRGRLHRDRDGLRRALPQRRRVEVPRGRPGLRLRPRGHRPATSASTSADPVGAGPDAGGAGPRPGARSGRRRIMQTSSARSTDCPTRARQARPGSGGPDYSAGIRGGPS